jgi:hypothetical protein
MTQLQPSATEPGHWLMGDQELRDDDTIEVFILGHWYPAQVRYDWVLQEYRLHVLNQNMPLIREMLARPLQATSSAEHKDHDHAGLA